MQGIAASLEDAEREMCRGAPWRPKSNRPVTALTTQNNAER
jgi:hypothetical protein